jgi:hypothetical protein
VTTWVVVMLFCLCFIGSAHAQNGSGTASSGAGVATFDNRDLKTKDKDYIEFGHRITEAFLFGGGAAVTDPGDEDTFSSGFAGGQISSRFFGMSLGDSVGLEAGLIARADVSRFTSDEWEGKQVRAGAALEAAFLHRSLDPKWFALLRFGALHIHEDGKARGGNNFKLNFQDSIALDFEMLLETYAAFIETGSYDVWGRPLRTGFLKTIQFRFRGLFQVDAVRKDSGTDRETDNSSYEAQIRVHGITTTWAGGEAMIGPLLGVRFSHAAGFDTIDDDDTVITYQIGITSRLQLYKNIYSYLDLRYDIEDGTGRGIFVGVAGIQILLGMAN